MVEYDGWYTWHDECEMGNHWFRIVKRYRLQRWRLRRVEVEECHDCKIRRPL